MIRFICVTINSIMTMSRSSTSVLFVLVVTVLLACSADALKIISVDNGQVQGTWGKLEICPDGSSAIGYQTQNDLLDVPLHDKSALNSIRLFCNDTQGTNVTSTLGEYVNNLFPILQHFCIILFIFKLVRALGNWDKIAQEVSPCPRSVYECNRLIRPHRTTRPSTASNSIAQTDPCWISTATRPGIGANSAPINAKREFADWKRAFYH